MDDIFQPRRRAEAVTEHVAGVAGDGVPLPPPLLKPEPLNIVAAKSGGTGGVDKAISVSELTSRIRGALERGVGPVRVEGEISNWRPAPSGHVYFTLRDANAQVSCVMWSDTAARVLPLFAEGLSDGLLMELRGKLAVYEPRGQYQIVVSSMERAGVGRLYQAYLALCEKLRGEGLFDAERKQVLPRLPRAIAVVTSSRGAALQDVLQVLGRRAPGMAVFICDTRVQGEGAAAEIARAIRRAVVFDERAKARGEHGLDAVLVTRGGGSIEDLWSFNEEIVARAIAACSIPVVSAVGHETDVTLADHVADMRAPTPSAAAEMLSQGYTELEDRLDRMRRSMRQTMQVRLVPLRESRQAAARLQGAMRLRLSEYRVLLQRFSASEAQRLPQGMLENRQQFLDESRERMARAVGRKLELAKSGLSRATSMLGVLDPRVLLGRGYAIVKDADTGRVMTSAAQSRPGQRLAIALGEGVLGATVDSADRRARRKHVAISTDFFEMETDGESAEEVTP